MKEGLKLLKKQQRLLKKKNSTKNEEMLSRLEFTPARTERHVQAEFTVCYQRFLILF
jgi:hypothetical protein